jgi:hypothetical protein
MILEHLNYLAVAVCAVVYFAIGGLWFSPMLFSKAWMAGHKVSMPTNDVEKAEFRKQMPMQMVTAFVVGIVMTIGAACLVVTLNAHGWMTGLKIGLLAGLFPLGAMGLSHMFTRKSLQTFLIDACYPLLSLIVVSIILSCWR